MNKKILVPALLALGATQAIGVHAAETQKPSLISGGLWGYITMSVPAPPPEFAYGVSLYATAWPLLERPLSDFQIGLCSIWLIPDNRKVEYPLLPHGTVARDNWPTRGPSYRDVFQTIEGGLGFWGSTHFGSTTAKFRMNGTSNGYNHEISSPGWGFGNSEALKAEQTGIAQISPNLLVPPDGLTFKPGTTGELFGYAWMALPLIEAKTSTAGLPVSTGNQSWTMFANSTNFKGPVAFYVPATWSRVSRDYQPAIGRGLDARPGLVTGGAIEINTVPRFISKDDKGTTFTRIPTLQFPVDEQNRTILLNGMTHYGKGALWNQVQSWVDGGKAPSGKFDMTSANVPKVSARPLAVKQEILPGTPAAANATSDNGNANENKLPIEGVDKWVATKAFDDQTFGLQWQPEVLEAWPGQKTTRRGDFPAYFRAEGDKLQALSPEDVPDDTGLKAAEFRPARTNQVYSSPKEPDNFWNKPGPKAGPFTAKLGDGSVVTYSWYRFIDQPTLQSADLSPAEKTRLQGIVEKMHREWTSDKEYLPPPTTGTLATLDSALFVKPPKGLEIGYVPIVTRQADN